MPEVTILDSPLAALQGRVTVSIEEAWSKAEAQGSCCVYVGKWDERGTVAVFCANHESDSSCR